MDEREEVEQWMQLLNLAGAAQADGGLLDIHDLARKRGVSNRTIREQIERVEGAGLLLSGIDEGESPILLHAGRQYLDCRGDVPRDVLRFLPRVVDDLNARQALLTAGTVLVDIYRDRMLDGRGRAICGRACTPSLSAGGDGAFGARPLWDGGAERRRGCRPQSDTARNGCRRSADRELVQGIQLDGHDRIHRELKWRKLSASTSESPERGASAEALGVRLSNAAATSRRCPRAVSGQIEYQQQCVFDRTQLVMPEVRDLLAECAGIDRSDHLAENLCRLAGDCDLWMEAGEERGSRGRADHHSGESQQVVGLHDHRVTVT